jgi:hypothetical protein
MADVGAVASKTGNFFVNLKDSFVEALGTTNIPEQIDKVDFEGLFTNPWFLVPFVTLVCYQLYKQSFRDLIIEFLIIGCWYATGTPYMKSLVVGNELQINKVLPVMFGGAAVLGFIIYLIFGRSD